MKDINSIEELKELSKELQNMKKLVDPTAGLQNFSKEDCAWGDRFLKLVEEIENRLKAAPEKSMKH